MAKSPKSPFTVRCNARFAPDGTWVISAVLRYRDGMPPEGSDLMAKGRLALLDAITTEALRGKEKGATRAVLFLDEGRGIIAEIDPAGVIKRFRAT